MYLTTVFALALAAAPVAAQAPLPGQSSSRPATDPRFAAWLGCWELDDERLADRAGVARLCVVPGADAGVRLLTIVGTRVASEETITADGVARPITDSDCRGTERAEWATTIAGFFRAADITCGDGKPRTVNSIAFLVRGPSWVDIQAVRTAQEINLRVRRYDCAADQWLPDGVEADVPSARAMDVVADEGIRDWTIESVIEVTRVLPPEAVQAAVTELDSWLRPAIRRAGGAGRRGRERTRHRPDAGADLSRTVRGEAHGVRGRMVGAEPLRPVDGRVRVVRPAARITVPGVGVLPRDVLARLRAVLVLGLQLVRTACTATTTTEAGSRWARAAEARAASSNPMRVPYVPGRVVNGMGYTQVSVRHPEPVHGSGVQAGSHDGGASSTSNAGVSSQGYSSGSSSSGSERTAQPRPPE